MMGILKKGRDDHDANRTIAPITADSLVKEVVDRHPQTISVFSKYGLKCVGCYISPFHTITDTAREYALRIEPLLSELNRVVARGSGCCPLAQGGGLVIRAWIPDPGCG